MRKTNAVVPYRALFSLIFFLIILAILTGDVVAEEITVPIPEGSVQLNQNYEVATFKAPEGMMVITVRSIGADSTTSDSIIEPGWTIVSFTLDNEPFSIQGCDAYHYGKLDRRARIDTSGIRQIKNSIFGDSLEFDFSDFGDGIDIPFGDRLRQLGGGVFDFGGAVVEGLLNFFDARDKIVLITTPVEGSNCQNVSISSDIVPLIPQW